MSEITPPGRYRIAIHRAMGCYFAAVDDLPGCFPRGASEVEAVENAAAAIHARRHGAHAPAPSPAAVRPETIAHPPPASPPRGEIRATPPPTPLPPRIT